MASAPGDPPAVARQRVRRALRKARDETPMSQGDVAKLLGWSLSKMQRIEAGEVGVSATDLRALLDVYGITDPERVRHLVKDAHTSRRQRYVTNQEYREHLSPGLLELMQFEQEAVRIRVYHPVYYPGFLQTAAVAEAILDFWGTQLAPEARRVRYEVRMLRRQRVMDVVDGPEYHLVLDESVVKRRIENAKVSAEQIDEIIEFARRPNVRVRLVPFSRGAYVLGLGAFQILGMSRDDDDDSVLYREGFMRDEVIKDPKEVGFHREVFDSFWNHGLGEEATLRALIAEVSQLRASLDLEQEA